MSLTGLKLNFKNVENLNDLKKKLSTEVKDSYTCDAKLRKSKIGETIWGDLTFDIHADAVTDQDKLVSESELDSEVIEVDMIVENIKLITFKSSGKVYLEMDAVIVNFDSFDKLKKTTEVNIK